MRLSITLVTFLVLVRFTPLFGFLRSLWINPKGQCESEGVLQIYDGVSLLVWLTWQEYTIGFEVYLHWHLVESYVSSLPTSGSCAKRCRTLLWFVLISSAEYQDSDCVYYLFRSGRRRIGEKCKFQSIHLVSRYSYFHMSLKDFMKNWRSWRSGLADISKKVRA